MKTFLTSALGTIVRSCDLKITVSAIFPNEDLSLKRFESRIPSQDLGNSPGKIPPRLYTAEGDRGLHGVLVKSSSSVCLNGALVHSAVLECDFVCARV